MFYLASGKLGAILSSYGFTYLTASWGVQGLLGFFAVVMFLGVLSTFLVPETTGITLEDLSRGYPFVTQCAPYALRTYPCLPNLRACLTCGIAHLGAGPRYH